MPDLRELRVFVAVAETLSFTRAAKRLHLSQQAVSKTVRDLELELGAPLFERTTREVRPTAAGAALLDPAKRTIAQAEAAFDAVREVGDGPPRTISVGYSPAIGPAARAEVVEALRDAGDRALSLREIRPGDLERDLGEQGIDFAVASIAGTGGAHLDRAELRPTPLQLHVPADHRLADRGSVALKDLDGERLLLASRPGTPYTDLILDQFAAAGATVEPLESRITGGSLLLTDLAGQGAVAVMPAGTESPAGVVTLPTPDLTAPMTVVWPAGRHVTAVEHLRERLAPVKERR